MGRLFWFTALGMLFASFSSGPQTATHFVLRSFAQVPVFFEAPPLASDLTPAGLNTKTKQWLHFLAGQSPDQLVLLPLDLSRLDLMWVVRGEAVVLEG